MSFLSDIWAPIECHYLAGSPVKSERIFAETVRPDVASKSGIIQHLQSYWTGIGLIDSKWFEA
jgi:hypothetical protein